MNSFQVSPIQQFSQAPSSEELWKERKDIEHDTLELQPTTSENESFWRINIKDPIKRVNEIRFGERRKFNNSEEVVELFKNIEYKISLSIESKINTLSKDIIVTGVLYNELESQSLKIKKIEIQNNQNGLSISFEFKFGDCKTSFTLERGVERKFEIKIDVHYVNIEKKLDNVISLSSLPLMLFSKKIKRHLVEKTQEKPSKKVKSLDDSNDSIFDCPISPIESREPLNRSSFLFFQGGTSSQHQSRIDLNVSFENLFTLSKPQQDSGLEVFLNSKNLTHKSSEQIIQALWEKVQEQQLEIAMLKNESSSDKQ